VATESLPSSSPAPPGTAADRRPTAIVQTDGKQIQTNNSLNLNPCQRPTDKTSHNNATTKKIKLSPFKFKPTSTLEDNRRTFPHCPSAGASVFPRWEQHGVSK
jgi:hypothetical protein